MLRRVAIVSAFAATLAMPLLSGCGIRGPLYMPQRPAEPVPPAMPDPGIPPRIDATAPGEGPASAAPASAPRTPQSDTAPSGSANPAKHQ